MSRKRKEPETKPGLPGWIMTYGDMMSLLLCFFILLVSFSTIQDSKFDEASNSLQGAFGVLSNPPTTIKMKEIVVPQLHKKEREDIIYEFKKLEKILIDEKIDSKVDLRLTKDGVLFNIDDTCLFDSGSATLKTGSNDVLTSLHTFLAKFRHEIEINGHTDSIPISTIKFPSNWELSSSRAISVARFFQNKGLVPDRIKAVGYGEYRPIADNNSPSSRAKNRRVEIFMNLDSQRMPLQQTLPTVSEEKTDA
jgi:chemotaxis protein MotB